MNPHCFPSIGNQRIYSERIYRLIALGLSLVIGMMRVVNFAQREMMRTGIEPFFSFLVCAVILFILGYLLQRTASIEPSASAKLCRSFL
jgi:hypothetical protein